MHDRKTQPVLDARLHVSSDKFFTAKPYVESFDLNIITQ